MEHTLKEGEPQNLETSNEVQCNAEQVRDAAYNELVQERTRAVDLQNKLKTTERAYWIAKDRENAALRKQDRLEKKIDTINKTIGVLLSIIVVMGIAIIHLIVK